MKITPLNPISRQEFLIGPKIINKNNLNPDDKIFNSAFGLICKLYKIDQEKQQEEVKQALIYLIKERDLNLIALVHKDKVIATELLRLMLASPTKPYIFCNAGCINPEREHRDRKEHRLYIEETKEAMYEIIQKFAKTQEAKFVAFDTHQGNTRVIEGAKKAGYTEVLFPNKWIAPTDGLFSESKEYPVICAISNEATEENINKFYEFYNKQDSQQKDNENDLKKQIKKSLSSPNRFLLGLENLKGELVAVVPVNKGGEMSSPDCYVIGEMIFDQQACKNSNLTIAKIIEAAITVISEEALADNKEFKGTGHDHLPDKPKTKLIGYVHLSDNTEMSSLELEIKTAFEDLGFNDHGKTIETA
ncbi:MAG: hypothetical protein ACKO3R_00220, partial [bacterium]